MYWRPEGWENHYAFMTGGAIPTYEHQYQAFEAGADAILEALKKEAKTQGMELNITDGIKLVANGKIYTLYKTEGQLSRVNIVVIPEEAINAI